MAWPSSDPRRRAAGARPLNVQILQLLWRERELSRADIAQRLGVSRSTVSEVVARLLSSDLVNEVGHAPSRGGRRPIVLRFEDDAFCILGVEMGAAHVSVALTNLRGTLLASEHRVHPVQTDPEGTRRLILELCRGCLERRALPEQALLGIGVGVPSPVTAEHPDALSPTVLPEWRGRAGLLESLAPLGGRVMIDNDANLGARVEAWTGSGPEFDDLVFIKVATGVGSGRFVDGTIARGATSQAGEISHLVIDPHGALCECGQRGCLSTRVSRPALIARANELLREHPQSDLVRGELTIDTLVDAALAGDPVGRAIAEDAAGALAAAIAVTIRLIDPGAIVIGGGIARLGDVLLDPIRAAFDGAPPARATAPAVIRVSRLGRETVAVGAATMILQSALEEGWLLGLRPRREDHAPTV